MVLFVANTPILRSRLGKFEMKLYSYFLFMIFLPIGLGPAAADTVRIASWNIANMAAEPGQELRGHARSDAVYEQIRETISYLDADIIALQEIGSIPGAQRVLGPDYEIHFETRCLKNEQSCLKDNDDIYTAIAVRNSVVDRVSIDQLDELALFHDDECETPPRQVRGSPVAVLNFGGQSVWIPSIHLKASCKRGTASNPDLKDDCELNAAQFDILEKWISKRPEGDAVILAGDFNRLLFKAPTLVSRLGNADLFPSESSRTCWADYHFNFNELKDQARVNNPLAFSTGLEPQIYTPKQFGAIDFFVVTGLSGSVAGDADMIEMTDQYDFRDPGSTLTKCNGSPNPFGSKLLTFAKADPSDHCPIVIELTSN
jgi:endonuclease/exonuclease/phosphatase family metal-dependent hydrolase